MNESEVAFREVALHLAQMIHPGEHALDPGLPTAKAIQALVRSEIEAHAPSGRDLLYVGVSQGAARIARERVVQIEIEGYTLEHDRYYRGEDQLAMAGASLALCGTGWGLVSSLRFPAEIARKFKDSPRIRQLEIAGALIAAEIDRILGAPE